jgi:hypothetical protein
VERGQLGTQVPRRVIFIWEGTVASLPPYQAAQSLERLNRRLHRWNRAVSLWRINDLALRSMWQIFQRTFLRIDMVVTTREEGFARAVSRLVIQNNWPVEYVTCQSADRLGRQLASMPDVERVYYGLEEQQWSYGPKGVFLDPQAGQLA